MEETSEWVESIDCGTDTESQCSEMSPRSTPPSRSSRKRRQIKRVTAHTDDDDFFFSDGSWLSELDTLDESDDNCASSDFVANYRLLKEPLG